MHSLTWPSTTNSLSTPQRPYPPDIWHIRYISLSSSFSRSGRAGCHTLFSVHPSLHHHGRSVPCCAKKTPSTRKSRIIGKSDGAHSNGSPLKAAPPKLDPKGVISENIHLDLGFTLRNGSKQLNP